MATLPTLKFDVDEWVDILNKPEFKDYFDKKWLSEEFKNDYLFSDFNQKKDPYKTPVDYLDSLNFDVGDVTIVKRWKTDPFRPKGSENYYSSLNITLDECSYWFTVDNKDHYEPVTFQIVDKRYSKSDKMIDIEYITAETYEKMKHKYLELVECIENRYDLSLEDLIMRF